MVWWGDQEAQARVAETRRATARWIIIAEGISAIRPASAAAKAAAVKQSTINGTVSLRRRIAQVVGKALSVAKQVSFTDERIGKGDLLELIKRLGHLESEVGIGK